MPFQELEAFLLTREVTNKPRILELSKAVLDNRILVEKVTAEREEFLQLDTELMEKVDHIPAWSVTICINYQIHSNLSRSLHRKPPVIETPT